IGKLNRTFNDIMTSADTKAHFTRLGWEPVVSTPGELGDYINSEVARWGKVLQAAGAVGIEGGAGLDMRKDVTIGLVVPFAGGKAGQEGNEVDAGVAFLAGGVGVRSLTPEGYAAAFDAIPAAADHLVQKGVDAIMVIGTSLTFYRGPQAHDRLLEDLRARTGLPVSTMSQAIVDGLREVGARRVAVATAYSDVINARLKELLAASGIATASLECFDILEFGGPSRKSEADIIALSSDAVAKAPQAQ